MVVDGTKACEGDVCGVDKVDTEREERPTGEKAGVVGVVGLVEVVGGT